MKSERAAWSVCLILILVLCFQLPGSMAQRESDYAFVRTLVDVHRQVSKHYVEPVDEKKLQQAAVNGMLGELDPFSMWVPEENRAEFDRVLQGSFPGVGIELNQLPDGRIEVVSPIDGSPAFKAGVLAGDIILKVNGEEVTGLPLTDVVKKIAGKEKTTVILTVRHLDGEELDLEIERQEIVVPTVKGFSRNDDNTWNYLVSDNPAIAYIRLTQFTPDTTTAFTAILQQLLADRMEGLILDLRFNPGGRLDEAEKIVDLFLESGTIVVTRGRNRPERITRAKAPNTLPKFPMIVLINEHSASASEIVAGSLMDNRRALVIGARSYGKGSVQEVIEFDGDGGELKLTVAYYYLPSGRLVHRKKDATDWGVEPQIIVPMDEAQQKRAMLARRDMELHRRILPISTTRPATGPATTAAATTQPIDPQLQRAVDTMIATLVLQQNEQPLREVPATQPAR